MFGSGKLPEIQNKIAFTSPEPPHRTTRAPPTLMQPTKKRKNMFILEEYLYSLKMKFNNSVKRISQGLLVL